MFAGLLQQLPHNRSQTTGVPPDPHHHTLSTILLTPMLPLTFTVPNPLPPRPSHPDPAAARAPGPDCRRRRQLRPGVCPQSPAQHHGGRQQPQPAVQRLHQLHLPHQSVPQGWRAVRCECWRSSCVNRWFLLQLQMYAAAAVTSCVTQLYLHPLRSLAWVRGMEDEWWGCLQPGLQPAACLDRSEGCLTSICTASAGLCLACSCTRCGTVVTCCRWLAVAVVARILMQPYCNCLAGSCCCV